MAKAKLTQAAQSAAKKTSAKAAKAVAKLTTTESLAKAVLTDKAFAQGFNSGAKEKTRERTNGGLPATRERVSKATTPEAKRLKKTK